MPHSVSEHLRLRIADYDRAIRTFIPYYDRMREVQLEVLEAVLGASGVRVIDLGGGTGALAAAVAERFSEARVEIWDTDPEMLDAARERCGRFEGRVRCIERSFTEPLPPCEAVAACIALHHVKDLSTKRAIYRNIREALSPGGVFLNADCAMSASPAEQARCYRGWAAFMTAQGIDAAEAERHFAAWALEDYYPPLASELQLLREAGFDEPDCFWRSAPFAVFGAIQGRELG